MAEQVKIEISAQDNASGVFDGLSGKFAKFGLAFDGVKKAMSFVTGIASDVAEFNKIIAQTGANVGASQEQLKDFSKVAVKAAQDTFFTAEQTAGALKLLAGGSITAEEAMASLSDVVSFATATGMEDLNQATLVVADAMSLFHLREDEVTRATDALTKVNQISFGTIDELSQAFQQAAPSAANLGFEFEELTAVIGAMADAGVRGFEAGTGLKMAFSRLSDASVQQDLRDMGIEIIGASGEMISLMQILSQLDEQTKGMTGPERVTLMMELFGQQAGPKMAALLGLGMPAIQAYDTAVQGAGGSTKAATDQINKAVDPVKKLQDAWKEFEIVVSPVVTWMIEKAVWAVRQLNEAMAVVGETFQSVQTRIAQVGLAQAAGEVFNKNAMLTAGPTSAAIFNKLGLISDEDLVKAGKENNWYQQAPQFANGGIVPGALGQPMLAVVHGGETVTPASGMRAAGAGGPNITVNITGNNISSEMNIRDIADQVGREIVRVLQFNQNF